MRSIYTNKNFSFLIKKTKSRMDFSNKTNISINTIKAILDKNARPSLDTLIKVSDAFNISLDDLVYKDLSAEE